MSIVGCTIVHTLTPFMKRVHGVLSLFDPYLFVIIVDAWRNTVDTIRTTRDVPLGDRRGKRGNSDEKLRTDFGVGEELHKLV